ncbi:MAG TPA: LexA family transcriptional regulator [Saprospiraceae bacterium]|nr:LexA family transcriptional regulator [Saprospiraceae bacterium]HMQ85146.1 LexA family transcriptional regulator [Saprospiraceae bacterium]
MSSIVTQRFIKCHQKLKEENRIKSSRQFAIALDYLPQSLSEILKGRRDVTIDLLRKAVEQYQINPVFIYTGEGPMFMTEENLSSLKVLTIVTNTHDEERIVHVPAPAQAGYANQSSQPSFIQELPSFTLPDFKYKVGVHRSFDVSGDSMENTLFEGDKVICSFLEPTLWESAVKDNYVYVIVTHADVLIKRVLNQFKLKKQLQVGSDNAFYEPYAIPLSDIKEIWYVRAKISPFLPSPQNVKNYLQEEIQELKKNLNQQSQLIAHLSRTMEQLVSENGKKMQP